MMVDNLCTPCVIHSNQQVYIYFSVNKRVARNQNKTRFIKTVQAELIT